MKNSPLRDKDRTDFLRPPFWRCPKCGTEDVFGVLFVGDSQYTRRCRACRHTQFFRLPTLNVSIIYLDQNILSNMLRVLDPSTSDQKLKNMKAQKHLEFYTRVFEKIHRLSKLHLLVCPHSPMHYDESVVSPPDFTKLKRLYELLSHGVTFINSDQIRNMQLCDRAVQYCARSISLINEVTREQVAHGKLNVWRDWLRITLNSGPIEGLVEDLRES
jgi:hypothetical protein